MPEAAQVIQALERHGLLLAADPIVPSVATIVAGRPVRGSWWGHPMAHAIFAEISALSHHPDAIAVPLVRGKVTFVHRQLWPALLAVGRADEAWQRKGLSRPARLLFARLRAKGMLLASGAPVREIARRLLARTEEIHTDAGSHAKRLETWDRWAGRAGVTSMLDVGAAKNLLEHAVDSLSGSSRHALPWQAGPKPRSPGPMSSR